MSKTLEQLIEEGRGNLSKYESDDERGLVNDCPTETRLAVAAWVMRNICEHARAGGSFRCLIYGRLGFGPYAYTPLYLAGGMDISNEFQLPGEEK